MPKTYRSYRKRRVMRKRMYRRRSIRRTNRNPLTPGFVQPTGRMSLKLSRVLPFGTAPGAVSSTICLAWQQPNGFAQNTPAANTASFGFNTSARWQTLYKEFEQYKVTGMKVVWNPVMLPYSSATIGTGTQQLPMTAVCGIDSNTINQSFWDTTPLDSLMESQTIVPFNPQRTYTRYFDFKRYSRSQNYQWQNTSTAAPSVTDPNGLSQGATYFKFVQAQAAQSSSATALGSFTVTWYVKVRGSQ